MWIRLLKISLSWVLSRSYTPRTASTYWHPLQVLLGYSSQPYSLKREESGFDTVVQCARSDSELGMYWQTRRTFCIGGVLNIYRIVIIQLLPPSAPVSTLILNRNLDFMSSPFVLISSTTRNWKISEPRLAFEAGSRGNVTPVENKRFSSLPILMVLKVLRAFPPLH